MQNLMILHSPELVTCRGAAPKYGKEMQKLHIIRDGAVVIEKGLIQAVGTTGEILNSYDQGQYEVIDAAGKAVLPGFVDSHTHFIFGGYRAEEFSWRLRGDSYMSIMERGGGIASTVLATREMKIDELVGLGRKRLDKMLDFGVTTVEGKSGYGLDRDTELNQLEAMKRLNREHPIDIAATFLGPHSVLPEYKGREMEFLGQMLSDVLPEVKKRNLAEFADIFCEKNVFSVEESRYFLSKAKEMGFSIKIHADEMASLGGAELAAELLAVSADHLLQASEGGIRKMAEAGVICTLLPLTAFCLKEEYAKARTMIEEGCAVALATDWNPGSCFSNSIPLLIALSCIYMDLSVEEVITALTINAAAAIGRGDRIGSIEAGKKADILLLEYPSIQFLPYHTGINLVETVIKDGIIIKSLGGLVK